MLLEETGQRQEDGKPGMPIPDTWAWAPALLTHSALSSKTRMLGMVAEVAMASSPSLSAVTLCGSRGPQGGLSWVTWGPRRGGCGSGCTLNGRKAPRGWAGPEADSPPESREGAAQWTL